MKIAIDITSLQNNNKVRGVGFYLEHLKSALVKYFPQNEYIFFERGQKLPVDLDLIHFPYFEPFFLARSIYKKYKTVVTVHDLTPIVFPSLFPRGIKGEIMWQMQKFSLKKANVIITDSKSSKKDILKHIGVRQDKVRVVYLAAGEQFKKLEIGPADSPADSFQTGSSMVFDHRDFQTGSRTNEIRRENWKLEIKKRYGLPDRFLLYVGDVTPNKNLPRLLDAVVELKIPIVMIGKSLVSKDYDQDNLWNHDLNRINELARENKNVIRLGFISNEDLVKIYNLATVFVMPSLYEGFGLPVLEAMACGCPVITSKEGSLQEVSGNAVYYVDAYNVENINTGIEKVFNNSNLREELSKKGFENIKSFSWKKTASETLEAYKQALE